MKVVLSHSKNWNLLLLILHISFPIVHSFFTSFLNCVSICMQYWYTMQFWYRPCTTFKNVLKQKKICVCGCYPVMPGFCKMVLSVSWINCNIRDARRNVDSRGDIFLKKKQSDQDLLCFTKELGPTRIRKLTVNTVSDIAILASANHRHCGFSSLPQIGFVLTISTSCGLVQVESPTVLGKG